MSDNLSRHKIAFITDSLLATVEFSFGTLVKPSPRAPFEYIRAKHFEVLPTELHLLVYSGMKATPEFPDLSKDFSAIDLKPDEITHLYLLIGINNFRDRDDIVSSKHCVNSEILPFLDSARRKFPRATVIWLGAGVVPDTNPNFDLFQRIPLYAQACVKARFLPPRVTFVNLFRNFEQNYLWDKWGHPNKRGALILKDRIIDMLNCRT